MLELYHNYSLIQFPLFLSYFSWGKRYGKRVKSIACFVRKPSWASCPFFSALIICSLFTKAYCRGLMNPSWSVYAYCQQPSDKPVLVWCCECKIWFVYSNWGYQTGKVLDQRLSLIQQLYYYSVSFYMSNTKVYFIHLFLIHLSDVLS